jgi:biotin-(acetyl-CoA carboxylase) ligase
LCESRMIAGAKSANIIVGMGLNLKVDWDTVTIDRQNIGNPISLDRICANVPDELVLLERWRDRLLALTDLLARTPIGDGIEVFRSKITDYNALLNRQITIALNDREVIGKVIDIDRFGRLVLELPDNSIECFATGKISVNH